MTIVRRETVCHGPSMAWESVWRRALFAPLAVWLTGCFVGYDSRWGQQKAAQQHLAAARQPKALAGAEKSELATRRPDASRALSVRLEPTATYTTQVLDYERHFQKTLDAANGVLEPALGIHLELADSRAFRPQGGEDHIAGLLDELRRSDPGDGVDWVIGLAGSVPRFEDSFHELGVGNVIGKHIVLRALNDAAEYRAIQTGLSELDESERDKLFHARLEHKTAVVLLHELGHTLGALHELDKTNVMNPRYSTSLQRFGAETLDVMRVVLAHRTPNGELDATGRPAVLELWQREPAPWVPEERAAEIARFSATATPARASTPAVSAAGLAPDDEAAFEQASQLLATGNAGAAFGVGQPLFERYPNVHAVSELRCNIAMRRGLPWEVTRRECAALMPGAFEH
jgi:hypothetical protein